MALSNRFAVVGHRLPRLDSPAKVTGLQTYGTDVVLPGMLYGKLFRSPVPHASIRRVDVRAALAISGVRAVITAADIPRAWYGPAVKDMTALAAGRVRYINEPIAAVAATSLEIAEQAVAAIEAEFDPLPAVFDPEAALAPGAPLIHPDWAEYTALPVLSRGGNVASHSRIHHGDVEAAFSACFRVYEHHFTTPSVHAGYTEPRAATARWEGDGSLTVWSNGQLPYEVQATLADILQLPVSRIRVLVPGIGGGFGGKLRISLEHHAALLARAAGRPVKIISTCEEEFTAAHPRQASIVTLRTGVARDGTLLAKQARVIMDCGAYAGSGPGTAAVALQIVAGPYRTPNLQLKVWRFTPTRCQAGPSVPPPARWATSRSNRRWTSSPTISGSIRWSCGYATWCATAIPGRPANRSAPSVSRSACARPHRRSAGMNGGLPPGAARASPAAGG
jgi:CO/xanthine dehydrogenase Mo-binding subunit